MIYNGIVSKDTDFDKSKARELTHVQKAIEAIQRLTFNPKLDTMLNVQMDTETELQWIRDWTRNHSKRNLMLVNFDDLKDHEVKL